MKLKVGDKILEDDGIVIIVYTVTKIKGKKAIAETEFEGKVYPTAYKTRYTDKNEVHPFIEVKGLIDTTVRRLVD